MSGGGVYYSEIWPGFQMNANTVPNDVDPMVVDHGSNHGPSSHNSRKRRKEDECARGGASTSNCYGKNNDVSYDSESKGLKAEGSNEDNEDRADTEGNSGKAADQPQKPAEQPKQDYIHVRARRGQAADSHSLAERARREKISERMKILQDLVPGCNKVICKALVLDEIINYIQSLQHQVEFLSMKLEAVNSRVDLDWYSSKDFTQQTFDVPGMTYGSQGAREYGRSLSPEWLHMQTGGRFERIS